MKTVSDDVKRIDWEALYKWGKTKEKDEAEPGKYEVMGQRIGQLVDRKQREYGDSWGKAAGILRILFPDGIKPEDYHAALGIVRVIDKLSRIANGNQGDENAWNDLAGYGLLGSYLKKG